MWAFAFFCFARPHAARGVCLYHLTEVPQIVKEASEAYRHLGEVTKGTYMKVLNDHHKAMRPIEINQLLALVDPNITSVAPDFNKTLPLLKKARAFKKEIQRLSKSKKQQDIDLLKASSPTAPFARRNSKKRPSVNSDSSELGARETPAAPSSPVRSPPKKLDTTPSPDRTQTQNQKLLRKLRGEVSDLASKQKAFFAQGSVKQKQAQDEASQKLTTQRRLNQGGVCFYAPLCHNPPASRHNHPTQHQRTLRLYCV
jgi:hypothetical protein